MQIRKATFDDLHNVLLLYQDMHITDEQAEQINLISAWKEIMEDQRTFLFLLEVEEEPVSTCVLHILPNLTRGARNYGLIENVVTRKNCRNRGYAGAVLTNALNVAWAKNCYKVMLLTGRKDPAVLRLYEKVGFVSMIKEGLITYPKNPPE